jgi:hypothetical protein
MLFLVSLISCENDKSSSETTMLFLAICDSSVIEKQAGFET